LAKNRNGGHTKALKGEGENLRRSKGIGETQSVTKRYKKRRKVKKKKDRHPLGKTD